MQSRELVEDVAELNASIYNRKEQFGDRVKVVLYLCGELV
jgi:hypothetical protein